MERINITKLLDIPKDEQEKNLEWALIALITKYDIPSTRNEAGEIILDVQVTINGVDVKLSSIITQLMTQFERMVKVGAKDLLDQRIQPVVIKLNAVVQEFEDQVHETLKGIK